MRWCQGVPQARTPWRVPVAGVPSRAIGERAAIAAGCQEQIGNLVHFHDKGHKIH